MNYPGHPSYSDDDYEGCVTAGRATGRPIPPPSEDDLRRAEEAWNDPAFYEFVKDEPFAAAGWVPKPTVDPSRTLIPSLEEIWKLPRWARVAFAARCARRVLPVVAKLWTTGPKYQLRALDEAVNMAEHSATSAALDPAWPDIYGAANAAAIATRYPDETEDVAASAAADAVTIAAFAVAEAAGPFGGEVYRVATYTVRSLCRVVTVGTISDLATPSRDFDRLCRLAETEKWTDDTPVPQSVFGPMWDGPPPWWTDDVLAGLPPEPANAANASTNGRAAPTEDATQPH
jgi:hypothetical protein